MKKRLSVPGKWREKLASRGKIAVAVLLLLVMLPTMGMVWIKDSRENPGYCASCHAEPYYTGWKGEDSAYSLAHVHEGYAISCQTCHDRTVGESLDEMIQAYTVGYAVPMKERQFSMQMCFTCHESYEKIIPLTDPKVTGAERNPHDSHWGELECGVCHNMHRDSVDYCAGCHDPVTDAPGWVPAPKNQ